MDKSDQPLQRLSLLSRVKSLISRSPKLQRDATPPKEVIMSETVEQQRPTIAVLGAGIGGLALAIGLLKRGVPVTIYEAAATFSSVGAGIGFGPNSLNALDLLDPKLRQEYESAKTANERPEFEHAVFDALYAEEGFGEKRGWTRGIVGAPYFTRSSAHRQKLLEILHSFIPAGAVQFGKQASSLRQQGDKVVVEFRDGTSIEADTVIGCDGVKGISRKFILGKSNPEQVEPKFSNTYIYRGIVPMAKAKEILGKHAGDAKFFMAQGKGMAIYPISKGTEANFVIFVTMEEPWTEGDSAVPCTKEAMIGDLTEFDPRIHELLDYASPLRWPTWHHPETSIYFKGRVCMMGDVAHATTPHQAAGAGQGLEDAVVLSHLLSLVKKPEELDAAFVAYDAVRRPRASKVVSTSYEAGNLYMWKDPVIGDDMEKIVANGNQRLHWIWQHDLTVDVAKAEEDFMQRTAAAA